MYLELGALSFIIDQSYLNLFNLNNLSNKFQFYYQIKFI